MDKGRSGLFVVVVVVTVTFVQPILEACVRVPAVQGSPPAAVSCC